MTSRHENVKWVDGLRGIASLLVVFTHLSRGFDEDLFKPISSDPYQGEFVPMKLFQYPILRVLTQGRIGVSIFSLVTGYVCALKPIRQFRAGTPDAAFSGIAKSAFRRLPRLWLPTTIATIISWFICQFGAFEVGRHVDNWWIPYSSPPITPNLGYAIEDLISNLISTWTNRLWNAYEINQWTLQPLLKGAFSIYILLFATAYVRPRYRMMISLGMCLYNFVSHDAHFGMQFYFGAFLSDLSQEPTHQAWLAARKWPGRVLSPLFIIAGLMLASYPEANPEWRPWSATMERWAHVIFPKDAEFPRYYSSIGLVCLTFGIHFSTTVKDVLSNKYLLWFGKNSFAVYLLHGMLLRTILVWMMFGISIPADVVGEDGQMVPGPGLHQRGRLAWYICVPTWLVILYTIANLWTKHVDAFCARLTFKLERYMFEEKYTTPSLPSTNGNSTLRVLSLDGREKPHASPLPR